MCVLVFSFNMNPSKIPSPLKLISDNLICSEEMLPETPATTIEDEEVNNLTQPSNIVELIISSTSTTEDSGISEDIIPSTSGTITEDITPPSRSPEAYLSISSDDSSLTWNSSSNSLTSLYEFYEDNYDNHNFKRRKINNNIIKFLFKNNETLPSAFRLNQSDNEDENNQQENDKEIVSQIKINPLNHKIYKCNCSKDFCYCFTK